MVDIRATANTGVTPNEVKEVLLQVAVYAGIPAANSAVAVAKKVYAEIDDKSFMEDQLLGDWRSAKSLISTSQSLFSEEVTNDNQ